MTPCRRLFLSPRLRKRSCRATRNTARSWWIQKGGSPPWGSRIRSAPALAPNPEPLPQLAQGDAHLADEDEGRDGRSQREEAQPHPREDGSEGEGETVCMTWTKNIRIRDHGQRGLTLKTNKRWLEPEDDETEGPKKDLIDLFDT